MTEVAGSSSSDTYSLSDVHGDLITTTSTTGVASGLDNYAPYGALTPVSAGALENSGQTGSTLGAFGSSTKVTDTDATTPVVLLGARLYNPTEGRFASVDPIEGGCANPYVYVSGDPLDSNDLAGQAGCQKSPLASSFCSLDVNGEGPGCNLYIPPNVVAAIHDEAAVVTFVNSVLGYVCQAGVIVCDAITGPIYAAVAASAALIAAYAGRAAAVGGGVAVTFAESYVTDSLQYAHSTIIPACGY